MNISFLTSFNELRDSNFFYYSTRSDLRSMDTQELKSFSLEQLDLLSNNILNAKTNLQRVHDQLVVANIEQDRRDILYKDDFSLTRKIIRDAALENINQYAESINILSGFLVEIEACVTNLKATESNRSELSRSLK